MKENKDRSVSRFALGMLLLMVLVLSTGLALRKTEGREFRNEPSDFMNFLMSENKYITPLELADKIIQEDPSLLMIDLRASDSYKDFSLPGAWNISPDSLIGSTELLENWKNRELVLFDNDERISNTTWILAKQVGYESVWILKGGLNAWFEEVLQPKEENRTVLVKESESNESESPTQRKASSMYFGVHHDLPDYVLKEDKRAVTLQKSTAKKKEVITKPKKKKKMPEGGC